MEPLFALSLLATFWLAPAPDAALGALAAALDAGAEASTAQLAREDAEATLAHGAALVERFECARCHVSERLAAPAREQHCVGCHQDILAGRYDAPPDVLADWRRHIVNLRHAPSLDATARRFRRDWLARFLVAPHDLRPALPASMPRLPLRPAQARAIAAWLVPTEDLGPAPAGDPTRGRVLLDTKGCGTCHRMTGAEPPLKPSPLPVTVPAEAMVAGMALAPDLRHTRARFQPAALVPWLLDPVAVKPDTTMPKVPLTEAEARDIAAYLLHAPLAPAPVAALPSRLPPLSRRVTWDEVAARVFRDTCWHCHGEPDPVRGDGGPGNTGGFGYAGRRLVLSDYTAVASGSVDDAGHRRSLFTRLPDGTPRLVAHLMARHAEVAGRPVHGVLGMPLGLPPLSLEDIQLVETWITQGRPR